MSVMESLFAPRKDHKCRYYCAIGQLQARLQGYFFLVIMIITSIWSWNLADGNIVVF